jgi:hypothetical protein
VSRLRAFIDDSGTHTNDSPICVAAGYFGGLHYWKQFNLDWDRAVKNRGLTEFHANRFWARDKGGKTVGEYSGWSKRDYEEFLDELLDIISRYKIWPVTSAVVAEDWNALTFDERRYLSGAVFGQGKYRKGGAPTKPYFVAFLLAVQCVAAYCDAGHTVDLVMDGSDALNGYAEVYFQELRASHNRNAARLGTIQAGDSRILPGLQAADLLAYLTQRFCRKNPVPGQGLEDDTPLGRAVKKARDPKDFKLFNGAAFDLSLAEFRKDATLGETRSRRGP